MERQVNCRASRRAPSTSAMSWLWEQTRESPSALFSAIPPLAPPFPLGHRDVPCGLVPSLYTFTIGALSHILPLFFPRFVPCLLTLWFGVCVWSGRRVEFSCHRTFQAFPTGFWGFSSSARVLLRAAFSVSIHVSVTRRCTTSDARQRQRHTLR